MSPLRDGEREPVARRFARTGGIVAAQCGSVPRVVIAGADGLWLAAVLVVLRWVGVPTP